MKIPDKFKRLDLPSNENGIVIPVIMWWLGVPLTVIVILWLVLS